MPIIDRLDRQVHRHARADPRVKVLTTPAVPPPRRAYPPRPRPAIGPYAAVIDEWLLADRDVPPRQRYTARRIWQRLVAEHGAGLAEVTVSRYARWSTAAPQPANA